MSHGTNVRQDKARGKAAARVAATQDHHTSPSSFPSADSSASIATERDSSTAVSISRNNALASAITPTNTLSETQALQALYGIGTGRFLESMGGGMVFGDDVDDDQEAELKHIPNEHPNTRQLLTVNATVKEIINAYKRDPSTFEQYMSDQAKLCETPDEIQYLQNAYEQTTKPDGQLRKLIVTNFFISVHSRKVDGDDVYTSPMDLNILTTLRKRAAELQRFSSTETTPQASTATATPSSLTSAAASPAAVFATTLPANPQGSRATLAKFDENRTTERRYGKTTKNTQVGTIALTIIAGVAAAAAVTAFLVLAAPVAAVALAAVSVGAAALAIYNYCANKAPAKSVSTPRAPTTVTTMCNHQLQSGLPRPQATPAPALTLTQAS